MNRYLFFAFRPDPLCFIHVLLNGLDLAAKGMEGKIIFEGEAVKLVGMLADPGHFLHQLYLQARQQGLFLGACRACSLKLGVAEIVEREGLPLIGDMSGHPSMADSINAGYTVLTF